LPLPDEYAVMKVQIAAKRLMNGPSEDALPAPGSPDRLDLLDALVRWMPGFGGYARQEQRRRADTLQREWLADRLQRGKRGLERYARVLVDAGQLDALPQVDRLRLLTDQLCGRMRGAMRGGGSFFSEASIDAVLLEQIYQHDLSLTQQAAATADIMESLGEKPTAASDTLAQIATDLVHLGDAWDAREELLQQ